MVIELVRAHSIRWVRENHVEGVVGTLGKPIETIDAKELVGRGVEIRSDSFREGDVFISGLLALEDFESLFFVFRGGD